MQSLTFITFIVFEKIATLKLFCVAGQLHSRLAGTKLIITYSYFPYESKMEEFRCLSRMPLTQNHCVGNNVALATVPFLPHPRTYRGLGPYHYISEDTSALNS